MADHTNIEYVDATWNAITGCNVSSPGCAHCFAMRLAGGRLKHHPSRAGLTKPSAAGPVWTGEVRFNKEWLDQPVRWQRPRSIFVCAHSDLFGPAVPDEWIDLVFGVMWACLYGPQESSGHRFLVLTKHPERMREYLSKDRRECWASVAAQHGGGADPDAIYDQVAEYQGRHPRIWLGASVEDQKRADQRLAPMAALAAQGWQTWVSYEPALGPVDWTPWTRFLNWGVCGGESESDARPMHPDWARAMRDRFEAAGIGFMFKQWGTWAPVTAREQVESHPTFVKRDPEDVRNAMSGEAHPAYETWACVTDPVLAWRYPVIKVGKKAAGRVLDGEIHDATPQSTPD